MFESGGFNPETDDLDNVMAISAGDSIYVAAPILCDPVFHRKPYEVTRIVGNIGRPGLAFLIPPASPRTRKPELEWYHVINHNPYDRKREDSLQTTSLILDFLGTVFR